MDEEVPVRHIPVLAKVRPHCHSSGRLAALTPSILFALVWA